MHDYDVSRLDNLCKKKKKLLLREEIQQEKMVWIQFLEYVSTEVPVGHLPIAANSFPRN